jgi:MFS family permease
MSTNTGSSFWSSGWPRVIRVGLPIFAVTLFVDAGFVLVYLIALQAFLPKSLHASEAIAGVALSTWGASKLLAQFSGGVLTDKLGVRGASLVGTGLVLASYALMLPFAHVQPWLIVGLAFLDGLGAAMVWPAMFTAGSARFEEGGRARFTAAMTLMSAVAVLAALGLGVVLNSAFSFDSAMAVPIGFAAAAFVISLLCDVGDVNAALVIEERKLDWRAVGTLLASPRLLAFALLQIAHAGALGAMTAVFAAYGRDQLHVALSREELLLMPAAIVGAVCLVLGGTVGDRLGPRRLLVPSFFVVALCFLALASRTDAVLVVAISLVAGIAFGLGAPSVGSAMLSFADSEGRQGSIIGWFMTADGVGRIVGPGAAGLILASLGVQSVLVAIAGMFLLISLLALAIPAKAPMRRVVP